ncbi:MAG TPA: hypothetical protein DEP35_05830 [Deltaproteobacteria bacterium]|nr:hypothetical protein [Deltaproteobacteria bacterium]
MDLEGTMRDFQGSGSGRLQASPAVLTTLKENEMTRPVRYALIGLCVLALYYLLYVLSRSLH